MSTPVFHRKTSVQAKIGLQLNTATKVENSIPALVYPETAKEISHCNAAKWFTMWNEAGWFRVLVVENSGDVFLAAPVQYGSIHLAATKVQFYLSLRKR